MVNRNILYCGNASPLPEQISLRAGPLVLVYDQGDLRTICLGKQEIIRRMYVAVRDRNWATIAPVFRHVDMDVKPDQFIIRYEVENRAGEIDFEWQGEILGKADGTITFRMEGVARSTFWKNRIGFCILHPPHLSGKKVIIEHTDSTEEEAHFPEDICANQPVLPFASMSGIRYRVTPRVWASLCLQGDVFEMEDQRLWTDASFKTFSTPLSLPYPVELKAGTKVLQSVTLRIVHERDTSDGKPVLPARVGNFRKPTRENAGISHAPIRLSSRGQWKPLPPLGLAVASHNEALSGKEVERLRCLHLNHLRAEIPLSLPTYTVTLEQAADQAEALGIPLELVLCVGEESIEDVLTGFLSLLGKLQPEICGWLVVPAMESSARIHPREGIASASWKHLKPYQPRIPLALGTNTDFVFLKRSTIPLRWMDQVCITLNPQVHAFDNQSMVESLETQPVVVENARRLANGRPVVVSPITLKPRFNPYATGPQPEPAPGDLPPQVDPRQMSLFGAGWTLGSLRAMVSSGAHRVTYYETTGWRGVMERDQGSQLPQAFPSLPGAVFPLYHVLADYGEFSRGQGAALASDDPLRVSGLALSKETSPTYLIVNHTAEMQQIFLEGAEGTYRLRILDEANAEGAMQCPEDYRRGIGLPVYAAGKGLLLNLKPFGLLRLDRIQ